jgi:hypothetical protein
MLANHDPSQHAACSERAAKRDHALRKLPPTVRARLADLETMLTDLGRTVIQTFHRVGELVPSVEREMHGSGLDGIGSLEDAILPDSLTIARARAFFHWKPTQQQLDELLRLASARGMAITWAHIVLLVSLPLEEREPLLKAIIDYDLTQQELAGLLQRIKQHSGPVRKVKYLRETGRTAQAMPGWSAC